MNIDLNHSWLHGKYTLGEINTTLDYVAVDSPEFFAQGQKAYAIILEILDIWRTGDCNQEEAFRIWIHSHL